MKQPTFIFYQLTIIFLLIHIHRKFCDIYTRRNINHLIFQVTSIDSIFKLTLIPQHFDLTLFISS